MLIQYHYQQYVISSTDQSRHFLQYCGNFRLGSPCCVFNRAFFWPTPVLPTQRPCLGGSGQIRSFQVNLWFRPNKTLIKDKVPFTLNSKFRYRDWLCSAHDNGVHTWRGGGIGCNGYDMCLLPLLVRRWWEHTWLCHVSPRKHDHVILVSSFIFQSPSVVSFPPLLFSATFGPLFAAV